MSDLISRSQLLKEMETWGGCVEALHEYIQNMPTAYDVDKVVEQLEQKMKRVRDKERENTSEYFEGEADGFEFAIETVKAGGNS